MQRSLFSTFFQKRLGIAEDTKKKRKWHMQISDEKIFEDVSTILVTLELAAAHVDKVIEPLRSVNAIRGPESEHSKTL